MSVSVIIPCHNYSQYLPLAIESAKNQTIRPQEILVVDDNSNDFTAQQIAQNYGVKYVRINHKGKPTPAHAHNVGIAETTGTYIIFLSADDELTPNFIEECLNTYLAAHLKWARPIGFVWTGAQEFGATNNLRLPYKQRLRYTWSAYGNPGGQLGAMLVPRHAYDSVGGYDTTLSGREDWDWVIRCLKHDYIGVSVAKPLLNVRVHSNNLSKRVENDLLQRYPKIKIFNLPVRLQRNIRKVRRKGFTGCALAVKNRVSKHLYQTHLDNAVIEVTNACNLKCKMCYAAKAREKGEPIRYITKELFQTAIDQLAEMRVYSVGGNFGGESLMHPDFPELLEYACSKRPAIGNVSWITNGMLFNKDIAEKCIALEVDAVMFSVDQFGHGLDPLRIGADHDVVAENIQRLYTLRGSRFKPRIAINKTDIDTAADTETFIAYWRRYADTIKISPLNEPHFQIKYKDRCSKTKNKHCPQPFHTVGILADGRVSACTCDDNAQNTMGNLNTQPLKQIWTSPEYRQLRKETRQHKPQRQRPCFGCDVWMYQSSHKGVY